MRENLKQAHRPDEHKICLGRRRTPRRVPLETYQFIARVTEAEQLLQHSWAEETDRRRHRRPE